MDQMRRVLLFPTAIAAAAIYWAYREIFSDGPMLRVAELACRGKALALAVAAVVLARWLVVEAALDAFSSDLVGWLAFYALGCLAAGHWRAAGWLRGSERPGTRWE